MVINSSDPNIIQKIDTHSYKGLSWYTLRNVTYYEQMIVNLKIQLIRKFSFCKIECLYYGNLSSSTRDTLICDYNQSARIRLKISVACLVVQCLRGGVLCAWRVREVSLQIIHKGPLGKHNNQGGRLVPRQ